MKTKMVKHTVSIRLNQNQVEVALWEYATKLLPKEEKEIPRYQMHITTSDAWNYYLSFDKEEDKKRGI